MKPSRILAAGMGLGLLGGALLLVTLPRVDLPCEVTITYRARNITRTDESKRWKIENTVKQKVMVGSGRFGASSLVCNVDLQRTEGV